MPDKLQNFIQVIERKIRASILCKQLHEYYDIKERSGKCLNCVVQPRSFLWGRGSHNCLFPAVLKTLWDRIFYSVKCYKMIASVQSSTKNTSFDYILEVIHLGFKINVSAPVTPSAVLASFHLQYVFVIGSI